MIVISTFHFLSPFIFLYFSTFRLLGFCVSHLLDLFVSWSFRVPNLELRGFHLVSLAPFWSFWLPLVPFWLPLAPFWQPVEYGAALEVLSDSQLVVKWLSGRARVTGHYLKRVASFQNILHSSWQVGQLSPRLPWMDFVSHIYREWNDLADEASKRSLDQKTDFLEHSPAMDKAAVIPPRYLRVFTDGSHRDGLAAASWIIFGAWDVLDFNVGDDLWFFRRRGCHAQLVHASTAAFNDGWKIPRFLQHRQRRAGCN